MAAKKTAKKAKGPDLKWWMHDRFGMFIHWGLYALGARHEWLKKREEISTADYQKYFDHFDPDLYDPKVWARAAKKAGMKYMVITTKHHEGFCLWDSKYTDYKATKTPCGKDLLKPMVKAFRDEGLRVGFYYSLIDWHHPEFTVDRVHPMFKDDAEMKKNKKRDMRKYAKYMRDQVKELLTLYKPDILWFDFSYPTTEEHGPGKGRDDWESEKLMDLVRKTRPGIIVNNRLDLPEEPDFYTPEQFQPVAPPVDKKGRPMPWEACQTFSGSWGYHREEQTWKSVKQLLWMLIDGVSKGGNLLLNVGPTARGEFDFRALDRLDGMGEWMRVNGRSIYGCGASDFTPPPDCRYTQKGKRLYLHMFNWPFGKVHLPGLEGKIEYAQFLHDASEVLVADPQTSAVHANLFDIRGSGLASLNIPIQKPPVEVPVVELFLK